jgi:hypothetical protein
MAITLGLKRPKELQTAFSLLGSMSNNKIGNIRQKTDALYAVPGAQIPARKFASLIL